VLRYSKLTGLRRPGQKLACLVHTSAPSTNWPIKEFAGILCYALLKEPMAEWEHLKTSWMDLVWLIFLVGLAFLPPIAEYHKQLVLLAIAVLQLFEGNLAGLFPTRGWSYVVLLKILLATLLIDHTGELSINSSYYPIYYLPVFTAAIHFEALGTLIWTAIASAAYCGYLPLALQEYQLTPEGIAELALRILFFFLAAVIINQFATKSRRQTERYQRVAEELAESNRQLERAQADARRTERLAALGQMTAGLAHEIRNPLGVIKGSSEMLNQRLEKSDPLSAELGGYISSEVNRLSALVSRFLDFARPLHAQTQPHQITAVIDRVLKSVGDQWKGGRVTVEKNYSSDLPLAMLDEGLCEQVFINLIQNAYEAMGDKGGELRIEATEVRSTSRHGIQVRLQDSGPGIASDLREQIFNPFFTTKKTGVGLGLSIVSKIMDEHHGSIRVESSPGTGTAFILYFPAAHIPVEREVAAN
jgi:two-component system sensor histidine kinase HydH